MKTVCRILQKHLQPNVSVWVFGSRVEWTTHDGSDLDLAVEGDQPIDHNTMINLSIAFDDSDLPYKVDVIDLNQVSDAFRQIVDSQKVPLPDRNVPDNNKICLRDVAEIIMGHSPPGFTYNTTGTGMVFFQGVKDFNRRYPSPRVFCSAPSRIAQSGDILFSVRAPIGRINIADRECAIGRGLAIIRCPNATDTHYIEFLLQCMESVWSAMDSGGTVFGNATKKDLENLLIRWPSVQERQITSRILCALEDKIELNRRMNQTLEEMTRALFKSWFVDFDPVRAKMGGRWRPGESLPGFPAHLYDLFPDNLVDSELGKVPKGWMVKSLRHYAVLNPESWTRTNMPKEIEYVDLSNTKSGVIQSTTRYLWINAPSKAQRILRPGDAIVGTVRPGNKSYAIIGKEGLTGSTDFAVLRPLQSEYRELVYLASTAPSSIEHLAHRADGAACPAVRPDVVADTVVTAPPADKDMDVLQSFSSIVAPIVNKMLLTNMENFILSTHRDTLLSKLMSGEIQTVRRAGKKVTA